MAEEKRSAYHSLTMNQRETIALTGVNDVVSFDEEQIIAETEKGALIIRGFNLHVNRLNLDLGELDIEGDISGLSYEDGAVGKGRSGLFSKLFK